MNLVNIIRNHDCDGEDTECEWITYDENEYTYIDDTKRRRVVQQYNKI